MGDQLPPLTDDEQGPLPTDLSGTFLGALASFLGTGAQAFMEGPTVPAAEVLAHPGQAATKARNLILAQGAAEGWNRVLTEIYADLAWFVIGTIGNTEQVFLWLVATFGPDIAAVVASLLDQVRKVFDPSIPPIAEAVLGELLGTELDLSHFSQSTDTAGHIQRAEIVGALLHNTFISEFGTSGQVTGEGGARSARRFTGFLVNFGIATAVIEAIGGMIPETNLWSLRGMGVEVARNLGLGRMHRKVMQPIIDILIDQPYRWLLNQQFLPTQFAKTDLVNPFAGTLLDDQTIVSSMALLGYSPDKAEKLIELHRKRLSVIELERLVRWGAVQEGDAIAAIAALGYRGDDATLVFRAAQLERGDGRILTFVDQLLTRIRDKLISIDEFSAILDQLPVNDAEKELWLVQAHYEDRAPHKVLSVAELQALFVEGAIDLDELDQRFEQLGFSPDDTASLETLTLLKLQRFAEAQARKKQSEEKKKARAAALAARLPKGSRSAPKL